MANLVRISESASLSLHAAALLARRADERVPNQEIAAALHASEHHLAKVMQQLVRAGVTRSTRGPKGGFQLSQSSEKITLLQLFEAVEGPLEMPSVFWASKFVTGATAWWESSSIPSTGKSVNTFPRRHWRSLRRGSLRFRCRSYSSQQVAVYCNVSSVSLSVEGSLTSGESSCQLLQVARAFRHAGKLLRSSRLRQVAAGRLGGQDTSSWDTGTTSACRHSDLRASMGSRAAARTAG